MECRLRQNALTKPSFGDRTSNGVASRHKHSAVSRLSSGEGFCDDNSVSSNRLLTPVHCVLHTVGYELFVTGFLLAASLLFLRLGGFAKANSAWIKPIVVFFSVTFIATAMAELLIAICLGMAFFRMTG